MHAIGSAANFWGSIRERVAASRLNTMTPNAESFFTMYHFGKNGGDSDLPEVREAMEEFHQQLHKDMNPRNLRHYVNAHMKRTNITDQMTKIKSRVLFIIGENSYQADAAMDFYQSTMMNATDKSLFDLIKVSGVSNVLEAAPEKVADSLLLFVQVCILSIIVV